MTIKTFEEVVFTNDSGMIPYILEFKGEKKVLDVENISEEKWKEDEFPINFEMEEGTNYKLVFDSETDRDIREDNNSYKTGELPTMKIVGPNTIKISNEKYWNLYISGVFQRLLFEKPSFTLREMQLRMSRFIPDEIYGNIIFFKKEKIVKLTNRLSEDLLSVLDS